MPFVEANPGEEGVGLRERARDLEGSERYGEREEVELGIDLVADAELEGTVTPRLVADASHLDQIAARRRRRDAVTAVGPRRHGRHRLATTRQQRDDPAGDRLVRVDVAQVTVHNLPRRGAERAGEE